MEKLRNEGSEAYCPELHALARKPKAYSCYSQCSINGVKYVVEKRDENMKTQNSGIMVEDGDYTYYGVIQNIVQVTYGNGMPVVLFHCKWFNTDPMDRGSTKIDYGLLSVDTSSEWYADWPYCLAITARQVFYLEDLKLRESWKVVNVVSHRGIFSERSLALGTEHETVTVEPYQESVPEDISNDLEPDNDDSMERAPRARRQLVLHDDEDMFEGVNEVEYDDDDEEEESGDEVSSDDGEDD